jgi:hypothetical protein
MLKSYLLLPTSRTVCSLPVFPTTQSGTTIQLIAQNGNMGIILNSSSSLVPTSDPSFSAGYLNSQW